MGQATLLSDRIPYPRLDADAMIQMKTPVAKAYPTEAPLNAAADRPRQHSDQTALVALYSSVS